MYPLEVVAAAKGRYVNRSEIMMKSLLPPEQVPEALDKLEDSNLLKSKLDEEGELAYKTTPAGDRQVERMKAQKRTSSFPPPSGIQLAEWARRKKASSIPPPPRPLPPVIH